MRFLRCGQIGGTIAAAVALTAALACSRCAYVCRLSALQGARTFYLYTPSSQAVCKSSLGVRDVFYVTGEAVRFSWEEPKSEEELLGLANEIVALYGGVTACVERTSDTISVYAYASELGVGRMVDGSTINLHIALRERTCAVGTPLLFDGF